VPIPAPPDIMEVFLQPGELYFGEEKTRIRTLLGSCVAISLWHPRLRIGGMCHYMLPHRARPNHAEPLDGRYADEAMQLFMCELRRSRTEPADYHVKLFGGGQMFRHESANRRHVDISQRNMEAGRELVVRHGFRLQAHDMGGEGHRNVILDLWSGDVWLKRAALRPLAA
jgi:chemotaxis protein CheD